MAIARALITRPAIVLADEPTGNLDTKNSDKVLEMLLKSNRELGQTTLMITHNPEAAAIASRILYMRDGEIVREERGSRPGPARAASALRICGKVEAELAEMDDEEAAEFLASYGLPESGLVRADPQARPAAGADQLFHRRRGRVPRLDNSGRLEGAARSRGNSLRSRTPLHSRRDDSLGQPAGCRLRSRCASQRHATTGRQGVRGAGWRCDAYPAQRVKANAQDFSDSRRNRRAGDVAGGFVLVRAKGVDATCAILSRWARVF